MDKLGKYSKTDVELGMRVHAYLKEVGVETPTVAGSHQSMDARIKKIEKHFRAIMETLCLDMADDSLADSPRRVAKMYVREMFWGLDPSAFPKCTTIENKMGYDEMVLEKNINVQSNCEHHFVIIDGYAHVAYIPNKKVLGISKINRVVEYFAKRPQIQERLTEQIYGALNCILETDNIAIVINAKHYCVKSRGVEDVNSNTITSKLGGLFKEPDLRSEFMTLIHS